VHGLSVFVVPVIQVKYGAARHYLPPAENLWYLNKIEVS